MKRFSILIALVAVIVLACCAFGLAQIPAAAGTPPAKVPFDWLFHSGMSLLWGCLGIVFWAWSKPNSQKLSAVWQWVKDNEKDTVGAFMAWFLVWLIWLAIINMKIEPGANEWLIFIKNVFPSKVGPFAIPVGICSSSLINHAVESLEEWMRKKRLAKAIAP